MLNTSILWTSKDTFQKVFALFTLECLSPQDDRGREQLPSLLSLAVWILLPVAMYFARLPALSLSLSLLLLYGVRYH